MKKIALSLVTIFAVVAMVAGATRAVFSDQATIPGNTISTATIDLVAGGEARPGVLPKPLNASLLVPGQWTDWGRGILRNNTQPNPPDWDNQYPPFLDVYMYVEITQNERGVCDKVNLKVTTGHADYNERDVSVYNGPLLNLTTERVKVNNAGSPFPGGIPRGWSQVIQQQAQLANTAGDEYQGKTCTWNEVFVAETR